MCLINLLCSGSVVKLRIWKLFVKVAIKTMANIDELTKIQDSLITLRYFTEVSTKKKVLA